MSRHIIPNAPGSPAGRETTVGWDAPLNTFFAMAFDALSGDLEDNEIEVFWVGTAPGEIGTIRQLAWALDSAGVNLPDDVAMSLIEDREREGDRSAGRPGSALVAAVTAQGEQPATGGPA